VKFFINEILYSWCYEGCLAAPCGRLSCLLYGTLNRALLEIVKASFLNFCFYKSLLCFRRAPPPLRQTPSYSLVLPHPLQRFRIKNRSKIRENVRHLLINCKCNYRRIQFGKEIETPLSPMSAFLISVLFLIHVSFVKKFNYISEWGPSLENRELPQNERQ